MPAAHEQTVSEGETYMVSPSFSPSAVRVRPSASMRWSAVHSGSHRNMRCCCAASRMSRNFSYMAILVAVSRMAARVSASSTQRAIASMTSSAILSSVNILSLPLTFEAPSSLVVPSSASGLIVEGPAAEGALTVSAATDGAHDTEVFNGEGDAPPSNRSSNSCCRARRRARRSQSGRSPSSAECHIAMARRSPSCAFLFDLSSCFFSVSFLCV